jgi:glycosyltransferase involved in cell wall biosynthesis
MQNEDNIKIDFFIGQFTDSDKQNLPVGVSFAGNYYQKKIRSILSIDHSVSILYSNSNDLYESKNDIDYVILNQKRHLLNFLKVILHIFKTCIKVKNKETVLFYNLSLYSLLYFFYFKSIARARVVVLLADAGFIIENNISSRLIKRALSCSHGILALREISEIRQLKPKIEIMAGIVGNSILTCNSARIPNSVLLSGSLGETTGLLLALEFFSSQCRLQLIITGIPYLMTDAEFKSLIDRYKCDSVKYMGALDYSEYQTILSKVEFSLNLRNPAEIEHKYNFPSKIIEYMASGIIVVSSIRYPELSDNSYYYTDFSVTGLNECFDNALETSAVDRLLLSENAKRFVSTNFSEEKLRKKISNLFN